MRIAIFAALLLVTGAPTLAQETDGTRQQDDSSDTAVSLLAGADYITGEIGEQEYETYAASAGLAVRSGRFSLTASVPYFSTTAPEDLIVGNGGALGLPLLARPTTERREVTRDGIGDVVVQAGYSVPIGSVNAFVAGTVKVPTASREKALGTGEFDYGVTGQVSRRFGRAIPFASATYTVIGEPDGFDVRNTLAGTIGTQLLVSDASSVTVSYAYEEAASTAIANQQSIGLGVETDLSPSLRLGADARAGVSDDAPDARLGLRIGIGF